MALLPHSTGLTLCPTRDAMLLSRRYEVVPPAMGAPLQGVAAAPEKAVRLGWGGLRQARDTRCTTGSRARRAYPGGEARGRAVASV